MGVGVRPLLQRMNASKLFLFRGPNTTLFLPIRSNTTSTSPSTVRKVLPKVSTSLPRVHNPETGEQIVLPDPSTYGLLGRIVISVFGERGHKTAEFTRHAIQATKNDPVKISRVQNAVLASLCAIVVSLSLQVKQNETAYKTGVAVLDTNIDAQKKELAQVKKRSDAMDAVLQGQLMAVSKISPAAASDFKQKFAPVL